MSIKIRRKLSYGGAEALAALHSTQKPISSIVEWTSLDSFRMRKTEDLGGTLKITVKEFQIKEIHHE